MSLTSLTILPFSPTHYPVFAQLWNEAYPELVRTELDLRLGDLALGTSPTRWVAEQDGKPVGLGGYEPLPDEPLPARKFQLHLVVEPEHRDQGIGSALLQKIFAELRQRDALNVRVWVRDDRNESLKFVKQRGFSEEMRTYHSALDVQRFDLSRLEKYRERLNRNNYRVALFDELGNDAERNQKTHSLYCEVMQEIPSAGPPQLPTLEEYEQRIKTTPQFFTAQFIASYHDEFVGLCILLPVDRRRRGLYADTLGVKRNFRGRGIAQALSHAAIEYAKSRGYALITADNFSENKGIIPLLDSLGFADRSTWTLFSHSL